MSFVSPAVTIFADDLGIEARGGLRTSAVSAPTRLQVMTGKYNFRNWRAFGVMDPAERTFAHELRDAGYRDRHRRQVADLPLRSTLGPDWRGQGPRLSRAGSTSFSSGTPGTPRTGGRVLPIPRSTTAARCAGAIARLCERRIMTRFWGLALTIPGTYRSEIQKFRTAPPGWADALAGENFFGQTVKGPPGLYMKRVESAVCCRVTKKVGPLM